MPGPAQTTVMPEAAQKEGETVERNETADCPQQESPERRPVAVDVHHHGAAHIFPGSPALCKRLEEKEKEKNE